MDGETARPCTISTYVFFDTETTGLPSPGNNPRITELCFLALTREELLTKQTYPRVLCKLALCFNPKKMIRSEASGITGLYNDSLELLATFGTQTKVMVNFLHNLPQPVCLVAHNGNRFDFPLLRAELGRASHESLPFVVYCADTLDAFRMMDGLPPMSSYLEAGKKEKTQLKKAKSNSSSPPRVQREAIGSNILAKEEVPGESTTSRAEKRPSPTSSVLETPTKVLKEGSTGEIWDRNESTPTSRTPTTQLISRLHSKESRDVQSPLQDGNHVRQLFNTPPPTEGTYSGTKEDSTNSAGGAGSSRGDVSLQCVEKEVGPLLTESQEELLGAIFDVESKLGFSESQSASNSESCEYVRGQQNNVSGTEVPPNTLHTEMACENQSMADSNSTSKKKLTSEDVEKIAIAQQVAETPGSVNIVGTKPAQNGAEKESIFSKIVRGHALPTRASYKLVDVYARIFGQYPEVAHTAEDDCMTMVKIVQTMTQEFIAWCEENAEVLDSFEPMY